MGGFAGAVTASAVDNRRPAQGDVPLFVMEQQWGSVTRRERTQVIQPAIARNFTRNSSDSGQPNILSFGRKLDNGQTKPGWHEGYPTVEELRQEVS